MAYYDRGLIYYNRKQFDEAIGDVDRAILFDPEYLEAYNNRGLAYRGKGNNDKAISDFSEALKLSAR